MSETPFSQAFNAYQQAPHQPIRLPLDSLSRDALFDEAKRAIVDARSHNSVSYARQVVAFAETAAGVAADPEVDAWAHWCNGLFLIHTEPRVALTELGSARDFYHRAGLAEKEARVLIGVAGLLGQLGQPAEAAQAIQQCITTLKEYPDYPDWPVIYINLSDIQGRQGDYAAMLESARIAEGLALRAERADFIAPALINQGYAASFMADQDLAVDCFTRARQLLEPLGDAEFSGRVALNLVHMAIDRGHLFEALGYLNWASHSFEQAEIDVERAEVAAGQDRLYTQLNMPREARRSAAAAAEIFHKAGYVKESVQSWLTSARLAFDQGEIERAQNCLAQAQQQPGVISPDDQAMIQAFLAHPAFYKNPEGLLTAFSQAEAAAAALRELKLAQEACEADMIAADVCAALKQPDARQRYDQLAETAQRHAWPALEIRARERLASRQPPAGAAAELRRAADLVGDQRREMPLDELKANLISGKLGLYRRLIEAQLKSRQPLQAAQTVLEAKGGLWCDLLAPSTQIPPDADGVRINAERRFWQENLAYDQDPADVALCRARLEKLEQELVAASRLTPRQRQPAALPDLESVRACLPPGGQVLEYVVVGQRILACVFSVSQAPQWRELGKAGAVTLALSRLRVLMTDLRALPTPAARLAAAHKQQSAAAGILAELSRCLVEPLEDLLPERGSPLVIAPDDFLFDLPWTALSYAGAELGEGWDLTLMPSSVLAAVDRPALPPPAAPLAMGCAGNPPLSFVAAELDTILSACPSARRVFPANRADLVFERAPAWLHVAAHARMLAQEPLLSRLELADGPFLLAEALNLNLGGTRLVTLSACKTGSAPERGGVALALAGAFLLTGAETVLSSLWPVDDQATSLFMGSLYGAVERGGTLAEAMRQARTEVRRSGFTHPFYWAAFYAMSSRIGG